MAGVRRPDGNGIIDYKEFLPMFVELGHVAQVGAEIKHLRDEELEETREEGRPCSSRA